MVAPSLELLVEDYTLCNHHVKTYPVTTTPPYSYCTILAGFQGAFDVHLAQKQTLKIMKILPQSPKMPRRLTPCSWISSSHQWLLDQCEPNRQLFTTIVHHAHPTGSGLLVE